MKDKIKMSADVTKLMFADKGKCGETNCRQSGFPEAGMADSKGRKGPERAGTAG